MGGLGDAAVGSHRYVHPDEAGSPRQDAADQEADHHPDVLEEQQRHRERDRNRGDDRVLAVQIGLGALLHGAGDFVEHRLRPNEPLLVSTGNLAVFSDSVRYDIRGVGGCRKLLFGGEGLFMTELRGPGWVMLQTMKKPSSRRRRTQPGP